MCQLLLQNIGLTIKEVVQNLKLVGLEAGARYLICGYVGTLSPADQTFYAVTLIEESTRKNYLAALGDLL